MEVVALSVMEHVAAGIRRERRAGPDRRKRPTTLWGALRRRGRRRGFRRAGEGRNAYVDRLGLTTALTTLFLVLASVLDAYFTLLHLARGADEANPLMALALNHGLGVFLAAKIGITGFGAWFLALHQHFPLGAKALQFLVFAYIVLLGYHAALFVVFH